MHKLFFSLMASRRFKRITNKFKQKGIIAARSAKCRYNNSVIKAPPQYYDENFTKMYKCKASNL